MASVQKSPGKPHWIASVKVWRAIPSHRERGEWRWTKVSTGIPTSEPEHRAATQADHLQEAAFAAAPEHVRPGGAPRLTPDYFSDWLKRVCTLSGARFEAIERDFGEFADQWIREKDITASTEGRYRSHLKTFQAFLTTQRRETLGKIDHDLLRAFYEEQLATGRRPETAKAKLDTVAMILNRAKDLGYIATNPAKLVIRRRRSSERAPKAAFTPEEIRTIFEFFATSTHRNARQWLLASKLGLYYGMRVSDATSLREEHLQGGILSFVPKKKARSGHVVRLPVVPAIEDALALVEPVEGWFCPTLRGRATISQEYMRHLKAAGVAITRTEGGAHAMPNKSFHSWRRTNASMLANAGVDQRISMLVADHDDPKIHEVYTTFELGRIREALAVIGA